MTLSRRNFLRAALINAVLAPLYASGTEAGASRVEYTGADDPAAYRRFLEEQSRNAVVVSVFHAQWCSPCKELFRQLEVIKQQPGVKIKIVGLDVGPPHFTSGPYKNIVKANNVMGTPSLEVLAGGDSQYKMLGYIRNIDDMTRYLRDMSRAVHGEAPAAPRP